jgi:hypothetical protein
MVLFLFGVEEEEEEEHSDICWGRNPVSGKILVQSL